MNYFKKYKKYKKKYQYLKLILGGVSIVTKSDNDDNSDDEIYDYDQEEIDFDDTEYAIEDFKEKMASRIIYDAYKEYKKRKKETFDNLTPMQQLKVLHNQKYKTNKRINKLKKKMEEDIKLNETKIKENEKLNKLIKKNKLKENILKKLDAITLDIISKGSSRRPLWRSDDNYERFFKNTYLKKNKMNNFPLVLVDDYSIEEFASKLSNLDEKNVNNILKKITEDVKKAYDGEKIYSDLRLDLYYNNDISESNDKENAIIQTKFKVDMSCGGCENAITRLLNKIDGVISVDINYENERNLVNVNHNNNIKSQTIFEVLRKWGDASGQSVKFN